MRHLSLCIVLLCFAIEVEPRHIKKNVQQFQQTINSPAQTKICYNPTDFDKSRNRSVVGKRGMVVCDDVVAGQWGTYILRLGGNAVDAAVATAFMLGVTRPHYAALGGGGFGLVCPAGIKKGFAFDFRETAPAGILQQKGNNFADQQTGSMLQGAQSCGIPGIVDGLLLMHDKYGKIHRRKLLQRPIIIAWEGTQVTGNMHFSAKPKWDTMSQGARDILGEKNILKDPGEYIKQPDLAKTLKRIAQYGRDGFYRGPVARKLVDGLQRAGSVITLEDLANYNTKEHEPLYGSCQGYDILTMPPSSAGGIALLQLFNFMDGALKNYTEQFNLGDSISWHIMAQALALVFADRNCYVADPEFVNVPIKELLSQKYLMNRWLSFFDKDKFMLPDNLRAICKEGTDTTHVSVIDAQGNAVSLTLTVHSKFGSGFVPLGTGVFMNNQLDDFAVNNEYRNRFELKSSELNRIEPFKRPLSSMTPTVIKNKNGDNRIVIGAAGGPQIISAIWQTLVNRLYFGMCLADAVVHPRIHHQCDPNQIYYERGALSKEVCDLLIKKGHILKEDTHLGTVQALEKMDDGYIWGISDPRSEGIAISV
ncbi:gamma-glutamyltransferase [candidate division TM6 bacterium RIFCSPHIGHO2_12_FULL_36_22]|nr:MAG: gamma-glutamyltransferase [candidate division TM6 bacterium RIFCSPHIGHO2_12_FULL_36_22]HLB43284.1 gamma-glutamyltransferase [Gammaproteobacteria bacterium]